MDVINARDVLKQIGDSMVIFRALRDYILYSIFILCVIYVAHEGIMVHI